MAEGLLTSWDNHQAWIKQRLDDHVPPTPRAEQHVARTSPHGPSDPGRSVPVTSPPGHGPGRHVPRASPRGPRVPTRAAGTKGEASHVWADVTTKVTCPSHVQAAVTVEVTAHSVKRSRPAWPGPGPRGRVPGAARCGEVPARRAGECHTELRTCSLHPARLGLVGTARPRAGEQSRDAPGIRGIPHGPGTPRRISGPARQCAGSARAAPGRLTVQPATVPEVTV